MAEYTINLPATDEDVEKLNIGDTVYINGTVCTARDMAHLQMRELIENGKELPEKIAGGAIFHAGPVMKKDENDQWKLRVIGPTTSIRMEPHADFMGRMGVKLIIGKGEWEMIALLLSRSISKPIYKQLQGAQLS